MQNTIEKMEYLTIQSFKARSLRLNYPPLRLPGNGNELQFKKGKFMQDIIEVSYPKITSICNNTNIMCLILITIEPKSNEAYRKQQIK